MSKVPWWKRLRWKDRPAAIAAAGAWYRDQTQAGKQVSCTRAADAILALAPASLLVTETTEFFYAGHLGLRAYRMFVREISAHLYTTYGLNAPYTNKGGTDATTP